MDVLPSVVVKGHLIGFTTSEELHIATRRSLQLTSETTRRHENVTYFQDIGLMVHVDGKFDGLLCEATEAAGRHDGYAALCHRLSTESDTVNTP